MAMFLGTSSPNSIVRSVATTRPVVTAMPGTAASGTPSAESGARIRSAIAGSAR